MAYGVALLGFGFLLVAAFIAGILVGRKNAKKVEKIVSLSKDPTQVLK